MGIYIQAFNAISPAAPFETSEDPLILPQPEEGAFYCQEPVYKQYIAPKLLRRMSRAVKMGVACASENLKIAGVENPDAILIGTGLGCVADTVKFLDQLTENKETLLNPTAFIQSTHNTVSGQIALLLQCKSYNLTFTQNQFSFETALLEGMMLLEEEPQQTLLVGGVDELTAESHQLLKQAGCAADDNAGKGFVAGEGAAFFTLSGDKGAANAVELLDLQIIPGIQAEAEIGVRVEELLKRHQLQMEDIDWLLTGENSTPSETAAYGWLSAPAYSHINRLSFKNYCGEYDTASAFALWQACRQLAASPKDGGEASHALIINHSKTGGYALFLLKK